MSTTITPPRTGHPDAPAQTHRQHLASRAAGGPPATTSAIRTTQLTKTYGTRTAVASVNLDVPTGVIAGFVGPNGAGKTTVIRMLLSLVRPTAGQVEVLGTSAAHPSAYLPRVGALIEGPAFYAGLSARRNLEILATLGGIDTQRVDALLAQVGLGGREGDAVKAYSLGMKQRLGIAAALLPNPSLLILDEPTNGLDPAGILEVRQLLRSLRAQGMTILISSHLLAEVEQIADWIILLNAGKVVYQGWMDTLLAGRQGVLVVGTASPDDLHVVAAVAQKHQYESSYADGYLRVLAPASFAGDLNRAAMDAGVIITELHSERTSLEQTFFSLTDTEGAAS